MSTINQMISERPYYLVYPDGTPVAIDSNSGGYPYRASILNAASFWQSKDEAEQYRNHFPSDHFELRCLMDWRKLLTEGLQKRGYSVVEISENNPAQLIADFFKALDQEYIKGYDCGQIDKTSKS